MDADDFQDLYKLLRGSRSAMVVLDSRALFLDNKMVEAHEKLLEARESFLESRSRLLKQDLEKQVDPKAKDAAQQIKKLKRKKKKVVETVELFDELMPALERLANRGKAQQVSDSGHEQPGTEDAERLQSGSAESEAIAAQGADVSREFLSAYASASGDERLAVISRRFGFREVQSEEEIYPDALYYIQTDQQSFLVRTPATEEMGEEVALVNMVDDRPIKPFSRTAFVKLGAERKMVLLTKKSGD